MPTSIAVRLQSMDVADQVLVLTRLAEGRLESRTFAPSDVGALFYEFGMPAPGRVDNIFTALGRRQLLAKGRGRGEWRLSPQGRARSIDLMSDIDLAAVEAETARSGGTTFGSASHALVPPSLAPPGLLQPLARFLAEHSFETNVFGMTRFPDDDEDALDPVGPALVIAREVCAAHGLEFHLASDRAIHDDLWTNVAGHMWASRYGLAFFEDRRGRGINYNLTIEVGAMLMTGRRCALLKDRSIDRMPTDLVGLIYKSVDVDVAASVRDAIHRWIRDDLGLGGCVHCPDT